MKLLILLLTLFISFNGSAAIASLNNNNEKHFAMPAVYSDSYVDEPNYLSKQKDMSR